MKTHTSVTAYLIDRLQAIASYYTLRCEYAKANYTRNSIKELRSGLIGGKNFAKLHVNTYNEATILGIGWDAEWIPASLKRTVSTQDFRSNPCAEISLPKESLKESLNPLHLI
jgi:hypothetical protein